MATSNPRLAPGLTAFDGVVIGAVAAAAILAAALWAGGQAASVLTGHGWASGSLTAGVEAVTAYRGDPGAAWGSPMPGPAAYWSITRSAASLSWLERPASLGCCCTPGPAPAGRLSGWPPGPAWPHPARSVARSGARRCWPT